LKGGSGGEGAQQQKRSFALCDLNYVCLFAWALWTLWGIMSSSAGFVEDNITEEASEADPLPELRVAALRGDPDSQYALGGKIADRDAGEAARWYLAAAMQGHVKAQKFLGGCFAAGKGVEQDFAKAVRWYREAAEQGQCGSSSNSAFVSTMAKVSTRISRRP
jgi:Sel1 repeat